MSNARYELIHKTSNSNQKPFLKGDEIFFSGLKSNVGSIACVFNVNNTGDGGSHSIYSAFSTSDGCKDIIHGH